MTIRNIRLESGGVGGGKCLELEECGEAVLTGCTLVCHSSGPDPSPHPARPATSAALYCAAGTTAMLRDCVLAAPGNQAVQFTENDVLF